jgi:glycosyltransferase involved in cell wall biosynthesis
MLSVLILTKNEAANIKNAISSVDWSDDVVVYDSESTDSTIEIASSLGARIVSRKFDNWSSHQNWAVKNIAFKNPWVLYVDADEACDSELREAVMRECTAHSKASAFRVKRKDFFMGKWLRRSQLYPTWLVRVFRPDKIRYERLVNPVAIVDGDTLPIEGHILHYPFSHGVSHWFERHNSYSSFEAQDLASESRQSINWKQIFSKDANLRRKAIKHLAYKVPGRPFLLFFYLYFFRLGFLDGVPGYYYSQMRASYELMIDVKACENRYKMTQNSIHS